MTPGARLQAAIELLHEIHGGKSPADRATAAFFRNRRYIGAKDRREVLDRAYAVLRRRAALDWWITHAEHPPHDLERARLIASLVLLDGWSADRIAGSFDGGPYRPQPLDEMERRWLKRIAGRRIDHKDQPDFIRHEYPEWLGPLLRARFGERLEAEMQAAIAEASTDLRANTLKATRAEAAAALKAEGIEAKPTLISPGTATYLSRLAGRIRKLMRPARTSEHLAEQPIKGTGKKYRDGQRQYPRSGKVADGGKLQT